MNITTNLSELFGATPLFRKYEGQINSQPAYIYIHSDGRVEYNWNPKIGNGVSPDIFHNVVRRVRIPNCYTANGYRQLHMDIKDDLKFIISCMGTRWTGNNDVGTITEEGQDALWELENFCDNLQPDDYEFDEEAIREQYGEDDED